MAGMALVCLVPLVKPVVSKPHSLDRALNPLTCVFSRGVIDLFLGFIDPSIRAKAGAKSVFLSFIHSFKNVTLEACIICLKLKLFFNTECRKDTDRRRAGYF